MNFLVLIIYIWQFLLKETKIAVSDYRLLIWQPCQCAHLSLHALGFSALLCFFCSVFIRFLILQSYMQDWLLQCTHIAHLTACMCPDMADLQRRHKEKVNPFGTVNQFIHLRTLWLLLPEQIITSKRLYVGREHAFTGGDVGGGRISGAPLFLFWYFSKMACSTFYSTF